MSEIILKLILLVFPKNKENSKVWLLFQTLSKDKEMGRKSNYAMIVVSIILLTEHIIIPVGIIWLVKTGLMLIVNKLSSHG